MVVWWYGVDQVALHLFVYCKWWLEFCWGCNTIEAVLIFHSPFRPGPLNLQLVCVSSIQCYIATGIDNEKTCFNPLSCKDEIESQISFEHLQALIYEDVHYITYSLCKNVLKWKHPSLGCEWYFFIGFFCYQCMFQCTWFVGRYTDKTICIILPMFISSSCRVFNIMLTACRPNSAAFVCNTWKVDQACFVKCRFIREVGMEGILNCYK